MKTKLSRAPMIAVLVSLVVIAAVSAEAATPLDSSSRLFGNDFPSRAHHDLNPSAKADDFTGPGPSYAEPGIQQFGEVILFPWVQD
jgi:hypothetical protein